MGNELDYIFVLKALRDIPFGVGKKLLVNFLQGTDGHDSITKNNLERLDSFGSLPLKTKEIEQIINNLVLNKLIKLVSINGNRFVKVMELSLEGVKEINDPQLFKKKVSYNLKTKETEITETDRELFDLFSGFLDKYNDEQKKAIICDKSHILCIAGAGSGKTTVLTKKIEFMINYKSIDPRKILAITFTRKARQEMISRLDFDNLSIETFNSFCEKILRRHNDIVYGRSVNMISYRDKIVMTRKALSAMGTSMSVAINQYFTFGQKRGKTEEQLANIFMNDCFFVRDYLKVRGQSSNDYDTTLPAAKLVFGVGNYIDSHMKKHGQRDFTDQLIDTIGLFESRNDLIPQYDYILIDEFQDINTTQIKIIELLKPPALFCVGDPRQSIFGWRGSSLKYILDFPEKYDDSEIITLTKNYRSSKHIVELVNRSISDMGLIDLVPTLDTDKDINLLNFKNEASEFSFVANKIKDSDLPKEEIFVLARTNRQLTEFSKHLKNVGLRYVVKSDEINRSVVAKAGEVTLATIHAIKGLEAEMVFVVGCTSLNFPCRGSEHPVIDMVKVDEYDKEEEEKRLFYVAMSRAKSKLYLTYPGKKHTHFITEEMLELLDKKEDHNLVRKLPKYSNSSRYSKSRRISIKPNGYTKSEYNDKLLDKLKKWRREESLSLGKPAFIIMHDKTIVDLVQKKPINEAELQDVYGMGPAKVQRFGKVILELING